MLCRKSAFLTSKCPQRPFGSGKLSINGNRHMPDEDLSELLRMIAANPLPTELQDMRQAVDADSERFPLDPDIKVEGVSVALGVRGEWTWTEAADPKRVVLYLHGGGYVFGSILSHRHLVAEIGRNVCFACGCRPNGQTRGHCQFCASLSEWSRSAVSISVADLCGPSRNRSAPHPCGCFGGAPGRFTEARAYGGRC